MYADCMKDAWRMYEGRMEKAWGMYVGCMNSELRSLKGKEQKHLFFLS